MKLENQVCTNAQAIRLKELGIPQHNSYFSYCTICNDPTGEQSFTALLCDQSPDADYSTHVADAFTVAELGVMLLGCAILPEYKRDYGMLKGNNAWITCVGPGEHQEYANAPTESQARAQLLIFFLERKDDVITAEVVNTRLKES